jgi:hypothetical protein
VARNAVCYCPRQLCGIGYDAGPVNCLRRAYKSKLTFVGVRHRDHRGRLITPLASPPLLRRHPEHQVEPDLVREACAAPPRFPNGVSGPRAYARIDPLAEVLRGRPLLHEPRLERQSSGRELQQDSVGELNALRPGLRIGLTQLGQQADHSALQDQRDR